MENKIFRGKDSQIEISLDWLKVNSLIERKTSILKLESVKKIILKKSNKSFDGFLDIIYVKEKSTLANEVLIFSEGNQNEFEILFRKLQKIVIENNQITEKAA